MEIIQLLLDDVDNVVAGFVSLAFIQLSPGVQSLWRIMLLLFIVIYGYKVFVSGNFEGRVMMMNIFKFVITLAIVTEWSAFSLFVYDFATNYPMEIAQEIMAVKGQSSDNLNLAITDFFDNGFRIAAKFIQEASWNDLTSYFYAISIALATLLFGGYAAFLIVLSKLGTAILLAVAPVFILMIVWDVSRDLFAGWLRTLLNYAFIPLFVYTLLALFGQIANSRLAALDLAATNGESVMPQLAAYVLATFAGFLLSLQIMTITASVVGGISLTTQGWAERATRGTIRSPKTAWEGGKATYQAGKSVGRGTKAAYAAASRHISSGAARIKSIYKGGRP